MRTCAYRVRRGRQPTTIGLMSEWNAETAQWYADKYGEYATNRLAVDALDVAPDAVIVDVGCGTGSALRWVAARAPGGELLGVDPVPQMLDIVRAGFEILDEQTLADDDVTCTTWLCSVAQPAVIDERSH
jgi:trans-aconitate methyltransferase